MHKAEAYAKGSSHVNINKIALGKYWQFIKWGDEPESILDIGIGDGRVTKYAILPNISKEIKEYIGSDISQEMLNFSKTVIDHPKYVTVQMDICSNEIPLEFQNRFDKIFSCFLLHMVSSKVK